MGKHDRAPTDPVTGAVLETPELVAATLAELRTKMAAEITAGRVQRFVRDDDQFLLAFLRNRKHDVDAALSVVISFSKFWYSHPEVIEGLCAARCRDFQACRITQFLNGKDRNGNAVMALYMGAMKPGLFTPKQQVCAYFTGWIHVAEICADMKSVRRFQRNKSIRVHADGI